MLSPGKALLCKEAHILRNARIFKITHFRTRLEIFLFSTTPKPTGLSLFFATQ
jgi:hypothetical protein